MLKSEAAAYLAGVTQTEGAEASAPTNLHVITGEVGEASADGKTLVKIDGLMFSESDDQFIEVDALGGLEEGDIATIVLTGEQGHAMTPLALGSIGSVDRITVRIAAIEADYIKVEQLDAATARIGELEADHVSVDDLNAATARIGTLETTRATITDLEAATARIGTLEADHVSTDDLNAATARIGTLEADHVSTDDLNAAKARIGTLETNTADIGTIRANSAKVQNLTAAELEADHATVGSLSTTYATIANLNAANGRITNLESTKANISDLEADYITADEIEATYMHANMSNSDVAWIQNGTIKDGAIVSAMINDVSANKLTAGTINGSVINVTNLNADNITTGTINGQRIGEGSLSLSKLEDDVYTESEVDAKLATMQAEIDGAIETWTGTSVPTLNNSPASNWTTAAVRDTHVGDVYFVVNSQSQQNGYNYRFTKSGSTYSWQLIKDSDVTAALSRLTTAEGKITTFDSDISKLKTDTGTLTTKTESLETRMSDAESDILDKVDTATFNEVSDTVDQHSQTISQHTTAISNKADSSTVTTVTNRVSKNEQDISGINTTIGELQDTVETKADCSTVSTISNKLNTVSNTVDGHTQTLTSVQNTLSTKADSSTVSTLTTKVNNVSDTVDGHTSQLSSITTTQTTMQTALDKTVKSSIQLWYSKANTTAPNKPMSQVTSTSTNGNAWRIVVPAYNSSYPHYFYCWQYEYVDGTYGWSAVVRDIAMGESQSTARTADSNASAAVTTANTANTNASTALTTANTANTNASDAKTAAATASTNASEAKTTAETAASDASTAKTTAASAVTTANSASTTATNAQNTANANIKSSVQLWFTKANSTAPSKPTSVVSTSNANTANAWNLVVPVWNKSYPHYFYCYQQQKGDGNYQWTDVVYDRATSEAQQLANTTSTNLSTLQTNYATFKQQTEQFESTVGTTYATKTELKGATDDITELEGRVSSNETSISNNASAIALKANSSDVYTKTAVDGKITQEVSDRNAAITAKANEITTTVSQTYTTKQESKQAIDYVSNAESNYGFQYHKDIIVFGDSDKYYPVYFTNNTSQTVTHEVMVMRNYNEQAPDDWNSPTHKGSLNLCIRWNFGGWGGADYKAEITVFSEMYSTMLGDVMVGADNGMFSIVFLRGGGTVGALYHVYSEVPFWRHPFMQNAGVVGENDVPYVGLTEGTVYAKSGNYQWSVRAPLTAPNTAHINQLYTVQRVIEAESSIVQTANEITSTVSKISSAKYLNTTYSGYSLDQLRSYSAEGYTGGWQTTDAKNARVGDTVYLRVKDTTRDCYIYVKATVNSVYGNYVYCTSHGYEDVLPVDTIKSTINQSSDSVKIQAKHVEIDGTAVFSAISSDVDDAITSKGYQTSSQVNSAITSKGYATTTQAQGYASTAKSEAISAAATDATTKANAAQTAATNAANTATDNKLKSYSTTAQANNLYDAKGAAATAENNAKAYTDALEIGGRNLLRNTNWNSETIKKFKTANSSTNTLGNAIGEWHRETQATLGFDASGLMTITVPNSTTRYGIYQDVSLSPGHYILSVDTGSFFKSYIDSVQWPVKNIINGGDSRNSVEIDVAEEAVYRVYIAYNNGAVMYGNYMKLEKGNKATDWSPAPEDIEADAVKRTQRIWYRTNGSSAPATPGTASSNWVTKADDGNDAWTKMHIAINSTHKHIYTCEQYEMANGTVGYTSVLLDNTITVIDGGNIITGSVTANKLNAANINASKTLTVGAMTDAAASSILNSNVQVGGRNLLFNTGSYKTWDAFSTSAPVTKADDYIKFTPPATAQWWTIEPHEAYIPLSEWDTSASYTVSIDVKFDNLKSNPQYPKVAIVSVTNNTTVGYAARVNEIAVDIVPTTNDWTHFEWTFAGDYSTWSRPGSGTPAYIKVLIWLYLNSSHADAVSFRKLKLEKGNKATDWSPAPEDMATAESLAGTNESLEGAITDIGELSDQLVGTVSEQNKTITDIQKYLNSLRQDLDAEIQSRQQWLNFNSAEGLVIGAAGSTFKTVTTNTSQQFRSGGTILAETSGTEFVAPVMRSDQILIGNWMWTRRDNGNLSLKWIG